MIIHGRNVCFLKTVGAACDIQRLFDRTGGADCFFNGSYADIQCRAAEFMEYLSMGFEQNAFWEARARGEDYQIHPIVKEEALTLDNDTFNKLFAEAQTEWVKDGTTVKGNTTGKKTDSQ